MVSTTVQLTNRFSELPTQNLQIPTQPKKKHDRKIKPRYFDCKAATINCRTASDDVKLSMILRECVKAGLLWVCLQEARMTGVGVKILEVDGVKWQVIWSGGNKKTTRSRNMHPNIQTH